MLAHDPVDPLPVHSRQGQLIALATQHAPGTAITVTGQINDDRLQFGHQRRIIPAPVPASILPVVRSVKTDHQG